jgi:hypothetical protein
MLLQSLPFFPCELTPENRLGFRKQGAELRY